MSYERRKDTRRMVRRAFKLENPLEMGPEHLRPFALLHTRETADPRERGKRRENRVSGQRHSHHPQRG